MKVIGTAGHVDHGKSSLVEALSGINPDRLAEEQARQMTIDLGFAWFTLPNGEEIGIVDVPGHRDFIENMLAGVGGIDAVLLVIAADEGMMPQTKEHLAILNLLQIERGVVALNKIDLVDEEWLTLVEEDIHQLLKNTRLAKVPIVHVSAKTRQGLDKLVFALQNELSNLPQRVNSGRPRLPIDRVFSLSGFGTIVTGTLIDGNLEVGTECEILPKGLKTRIRGLQTHKRKEEIAFAGSRTAANLSGVSVDQIRRGDVLVGTGSFRPTQRLDVRFRLLPDATRNLKHNTEVKLFLYTSEVLGRVRLLGAEELPPGEEGWLQIELQSPVVAARGDRFILRRPSPSETLGGGVVLDPFPLRRYRRFSNEWRERLEALSLGTPKEVILNLLQRNAWMTLTQLLQESNFAPEKVEQAISSLLQEGLIIDPQQRFSKETKEKLEAPLIARSRWEEWQKKAQILLEEYHQSYPLRRGMPREELKARLKLPSSLFQTLVETLKSQGKVKEEKTALALSEFQIRLSPGQQEQVNTLLRLFAQAPFSPPSVKECKQKLGEELYTALLELEELIQVSEEVVFRRQDYLKAKETVRQLITNQGEISAAQVRDHLQTSRKYALALLEYLDQIGFTERRGDVRILKSTALPARER
ncbi:MAG: selenocysteine-specific translation elongation factor [Anaerolineales bacterium]|nr:selenocysteine-specific translation elongation factor [Anaerolineales bacterium]MDW8448273.1 selenocysteine-specific translation elongation factor [Anaerolineales bacterium]